MNSLSNKYIRRANRIAARHKGTSMERAYHSLAGLYASLLEDGRALQPEGLIIHELPSLKVFKRERLKQLITKR